MPRFCPIREVHLMPTDPDQCIEGLCGWYHIPSAACAPLFMAEKLDELSDNLDKLIKELPGGD